MASSTPHTILLVVNGSDRPIFEHEANEALTPGELVAFDADDELVPHGTAGGNAQAIFVVEDPYNGVTTAAAIDTDYATGEQTRVVYAQPGDVVYAFCPTGQTIAKGDPLESDGAGGLQKHVPDTIDAGGSTTYTIYARGIVAWAAEDKTNSTGSRARIRARVA